MTEAGENACTSAMTIVGVDGSAGSQTALDWAVAKSELLGPIKPVAAFHIEALAEGVDVPTLHRDLSRLMREDATANLVSSLESSHPDLLARSEVIRGYAGPALVKAAAGQRLLVVGSRGRSALAETLLGSVTSYCVKHATVPVAVIPGDSPTDAPLHHLVVGIDGSENSRAALRWALDHVADGGHITALIAWMPAPWGMELIPPVPEMSDGARTTVASVVKRVTAEAEADGDRLPTIETEVVMGDARNVLRGAAERADLLVVGARGHEGAVHLLLGSVTTSLIHHPTAPTVVVPAP